MSVLTEKMQSDNQRKENKKIEREEQAKKKAEAEEAKEAEGRKKQRRRTIKKDTAFSGRCTAEAWDLFDKINSREGMSNNSVLNMLINQYIRQKRHILDD